MPRHVPRWREHIALGIAAAALIGFLDALAAIIRLRPWSMSALGAPWLAAAVMVPAGVVIGAGALAFERLALQRGPLPWLRARIAAHHDSVLWVAAGTLAFGVLLALGALAASRYVAFALALQDDALREHLSMFVFASGVLLLCALALPLAWWLRTPLARVWPALAAKLGGRFAFATRAACACALAVPLVAFLRAHVALLGPLFVLPYAWLLALTLGLLWASPLRTRLARASARPGYWIGVIAAFLTCAPLLSANAALASAFGRSTAPARLAALLAHLTDVDGDGQSSLFGERDCAPFDGGRSPLAYDAPGDHVDQDCDGRDARRSAGTAANAAAELPLPPELVRKYNVVLIVIDAFRGDRAPLVARRSLTPGLDRLAAESIVFTEAFSQSPSTRISFPSFLSGRLPAHLTWVRQNDWLQGTSKDGMLAERLKRTGYRTAFVQNGWVHDKLPALRAGYDAVFNMRRPSGGGTLPWALGGAGASTRAIEFIENVTRKPDPFFLTLYYDGPHAPYENLREFGVPARSNHALDRYEAEIKFVDQEAGHFIDYLRAKPKLWANTIVFVTADHGEEFGEHGGAFHDRTCYRESTHVPLIVRVPGLQPAVARKRVALVDLVPTVLALTGASRSGGLDGRNLIAADPARYLAAPDERVACTAFDDRHPNQTLTHALRDDHWLYVRHFGGDASEVYDMQRDPKESNNLVTRPEGASVEQRLRAELEPLQTR